MSAVVPEVVDDIGVGPALLGVGGIEVGNGLVVHGVHDIHRCLGFPCIGDDGVLHHSLEQFADLLALHVHAGFGKHIAGDLSAKQLVDLGRGVQLAVDPIVELIAEPGLHHRFQIQVKVVAFDHSLQHERHGYGIVRHILGNEPLIGSLDVIRSAAGKHPTDLDRFV